MRKAREYYLDKTDRVLERENEIHEDLDRRLDALEERDADMEAAAREVIDRATLHVARVLAPIAAELEERLGEIREGVPASVVTETPQRRFLSAPDHAAFSAKPTTGEVEAAIGAATTGLAPLSSPAFAGNPTAPTPPSGNSSPRLATTAFVQIAIAALKNFLTNGAGTALDQFNELAEALGNDPNFAATMLAELGHRVRFDQAQTMSPEQAAQARSNIAAQAALDFQPVQQGTGIGQEQNNVAIGWAGDRLKVTVDAVDLGEVWTEIRATGAVATDGSGGTGAVQRFPSGLILVCRSSVVEVDADGIAEIAIGHISVSGLWYAVACNGDFASVPGHVAASSFTDRGFLVRVAGAPRATVRVNWQAWGRWR